MIQIIGLIISTDVILIFLPDIESLSLPLVNALLSVGTVVLVEFISAAVSSKYRSFEESAK